jgi:hypothetical protein
MTQLYGLGGRKMNVGSVGKYLLLLFAVVVLVSFASAATPVSPTNMTVGTSARGNITGTSQNTSAEAGNVTRLDIEAYQLTKSWQGYYGNVTGKILLSDGSNNRMYDWNFTSPTGQVYASRNSTVDWSTMNCSTAGQITLETTALGQTATDADSVANTFTSTSHPDFTIGTNTISGCKSTTLFNASGAQSTFFWNVLLSDSVNRTVYSSILNNTAGFQGSNINFELLVGEDGHGSAANTVTTYYFFVQLA